MWQCRAGFFVSQSVLAQDSLTQRLQETLCRFSSNVICSALVQESHSAVGSHTEQSWEYLKALWVRGVILFYFFFLWVFKQLCSSALLSCVFVPLGARQLAPSSFVCCVGHPWAKQTQTRLTTHVVLHILLVKQWHLTKQDIQWVNYGRIVYDFLLPFISTPTPCKSMQWSSLLPPCARMINGGTTMRSISWGRLEAERWSVFLYWTLHSHSKPWPGLQWFITGAVFWSLTFSTLPWLQKSGFHYQLKSRRRDPFKNLKCEPQVEDGENDDAFWNSVVRSDHFLSLRGKISTVAELLQPSS